VVGSFTTVNASQRRRVARLNPDGSLDASFNPGAGLDNTAYAVALQPDGKILVGGLFTNAINSSTPSPRLVRLNANGTLDATFTSGFTISNAWVYALAVMRDGRIVVGGVFSQYAGQPRSSVIRLHSDGSLDSSFIAALQGHVLHLALQHDGKVLAAGAPLRLGTNAIYHAAVRLRPDGAVDSAFVQAPVEWSNLAPFGVSGLALDPDGNIYVSGTFSRYDGFPRFGLARLHGNPIIYAPSFTAAAFTTFMYLEAGRTYFFESTPTLNPPAWTVLDSVSGNNNIYTFEDPSPPPSRRFYRIRVE